MGKTAILFDLDGTLTDSKPGILNCLRKTIEAHQIQWEGSLDRFIGPPVEEWAKELLPNGDEATHVKIAADYRKCYDLKGWSENSVYPGIPELLDELKRHGYPLFVCTSKQEHFAIRILKKFGLADYFTTIHGDRADFRSHSKIDLMAHLLKQESLDPANTWMIGDRRFDIEAAKANDVRVIAVGFGYGSMEEFAEARPDAICPTPADILDFLLKQDSASGDTMVPLQQEA